jgi:molybdenum cofactor biosynthesis enzyme MoaA
MIAEAGLAALWLAAAMALLQLIGGLTLLRGGAGDEALRAAVGGVWAERNDRYSEERGRVGRPKAEMSYLGG